MQGRLIIIEGLDGSGKATQSELLTDMLQQEGYAVRKVSFPNYKSPASSLAKMYLDGEFGTKPEDVNAYAASTFYAVDRYASFKTEWASFYQQGGIIIADRYTTSNAIHQCSKLQHSEWDGYLAWLFDFEYQKMGIPAPDAVVYLDMSVHVSQKLMQQRYSGDNNKKDIHERDEQYLNRSREAAQYCAQKYSWEKVRCDDGQQPYVIEKIANQVTDIVKQILSMK